MTKVTGAVHGVNIELLKRAHALSEAMGVDLRCGGGIRSYQRQVELYEAREKYLAYRRHLAGGPWAPYAPFQATAAAPGTSWHGADPGPRGAMDLFGPGVGDQTPQSDPRTLRSHNTKVEAAGLYLAVASEHWHVQRRDRNRAEHFATMGDEPYYTGHAAWPPKLGANTLEEGSVGPDVEELQEWLGITADGDFGPRTAERLVAVQTANGLTPDGVAGAGTFALLGRRRVSLAGLDAACLNDDGTWLRNLAAAQAVFLP